MDVLIHLASQEELAATIFMQWLINIPDLIFVQVSSTFDAFCALEVSNTLKTLDFQLGSCVIKRVKNSNI